LGEVGDLIKQMGFNLSWLLQACSLYGSSKDP